MATPPNSSSTSLTTSDLAFIDAAIAMQRAIQAPPAPAGAPSVAFQPALFIGVISLVTAAIQVATFVYHAVKGHVAMAVPQLSSDVSSTASLNELIAKRNELSKALGDPSVLK